jgi:glutamine synthetase
VRCVPDLSDPARATWHERTRLVLCDVYEEPGEALVSVAPRTILAPSGRAPGGGLRADAAPRSWSSSSCARRMKAAHAKGFDRSSTAGWFIEDYHTLQGTKVEPLVGAIRRHGISRACRSSRRKASGAPASRR